jgi:hypothetical protein
MIIFVVVIYFKLFSFHFIIIRYIYIDFPSIFELEREINSFFSYIYSKWRKKRKIYKANFEIHKYLVHTATNSICIYQIYIYSINHIYDTTILFILIIEVYLILFIYILKIILICEYYIYKKGMFMS